MGGSGEPALSAIEAALKSGKSVSNSVTLILVRARAY